MGEIEDLKMELEKFAKIRDWDKFHSPKNLAISLSIEASELLEIFQWLSEDESSNLPDDKLTEAGFEIADVLIYLIRLSDKLGIDPIDYAKRKIEINKKRYPDELVKGSSMKYTEYNK